MKIYYDTLQRFDNRIVNTWIKTGTKFNLGNVQILKYAWICKRYWSNKKGEKVVKVNIVDTNQLKMF